MGVEVSDDRKTQLELGGMKSGMPEQNEGLILAYRSRYCKEVVSSGLSAGLQGNNYPEPLRVSFFSSTQGRL